ncbi:MAG: hypothetical protein M1837_005810 [Sclerophora amabilis]|nr:MAG: hypothetical protein M1837_005810 [Sclerophora amabilis]
MAKGLRSSVKKTNRSKLRSRVMGPVEDARRQRLSAKLLELSSNPKPANPEIPTETKMEVLEDGEAVLSSAAVAREVAHMRTELPNHAGGEEKDPKKSGGGSKLLSMPVPAFLLAPNCDADPAGPEASAFFTAMGLIGGDSIQGFAHDGSILFSV